MSPNMETAHLVCMILLMWLSGISATSTTPKLKEIFIGRCWDFQHMIRPELFINSTKNCTVLWQHFADAFMYKPPCNTTLEDYRPFSEAAVHPIPADKSLFWEGVFPFVNEYSQNGKHYTTVSDTLLGYMADGLFWCGQVEDPGINYDVCPTWSECEALGSLQADYVYWLMTSEPFSLVTFGVSHVLLNGSIPKAFLNDSIFATKELVNLTPEHGVTGLNILVMYDLGGTVYERCEEGTILMLEEIARGQGLSVSCKENPESIRMFQCVNAPNHPECVLALCVNETSISRPSLVNILVYLTAAWILLYTTWGLLH